MLLAWRDRWRERASSRAVTSRRMADPRALREELDGADSGRMPEHGMTVVRDSGLVSWLPDPYDLPIRVRRRQERQRG